MSVVNTSQHAGWQLAGVQCGSEVLSAAVSDGGVVLQGRLEIDGVDAAWTLGFLITTDAGWRSVAMVGVRHESGTTQRCAIERRDGVWWVGGQVRRDLDGCLDIAIEHSAATVSLPLRREDLALGVAVSVPAVLVRSRTLHVERLEQTFTRLADGRFAYATSLGDGSSEVTVDAAGLVLCLPGVAARSY